MVHKRNEKIDWIEEQSLYAYIAEYYKDAIFKYKPKWGKEFSFDVYIPRLNLVIEYESKWEYKTENERKSYEKKIAEYERKKELCQQNGVCFVGWDGVQAVTKESVSKFVEKNSKIF